MNYNPLISVIIPVYNVAEYLEQCLESVINQTYQNLEIICVDDCSTDNSPQILEYYVNKDPRIKFIKNTSNIGLGYTRNNGLAIATGDYIHFLDSDDWMELNAYETMVNHLRNSGNVDVLRFVWKSIDNNTLKETIHEYPHKEHFNKIIIFLNTPECMPIWSTSAWIQLLKREFLQKHNLSFNNHRCFEDVEFSIRVLLKANSIIFTSDCLLNYRDKRPNSLLSKKLEFTKELAQDAILSNELSKELPLINRIVLANFIYAILINNAFDAYYNNILSFRELKQIFQKAIIKELFVKNKILIRTDRLYINVNNVFKLGATRFFFAYKVRRFIRESSPFLSDCYKNIRRFLNKESSQNGI